MDPNSVSTAPTPTAPMAEFDDKTTPPSPSMGDDTNDTATVVVPMEEEEEEEPPPPPPLNHNKKSGVQLAKEKEAQSEGHRYADSDDYNEWSCGSWFEYLVVVVLAVILLIGSLALTLYWVVQYRGGFAWRDDPKRQFNLHPVLMVAGFITFSGFSVLLYRICRCCRRIYVKLLHTIFHALTVPCVVLGFMAVLDSHNLAQPPLPNFYSLHSWIGLVTMGLFAIQFVVGFFSFLILLCCEGATAGFRARLVPIHAAFGLTTFFLAVTACATGLTEKALFTLGETYPTWPEEGIVINAIGVSLVALAILICFAVRSKENIIKVAATTSATTVGGAI